MTDVQTAYCKLQTEVEEISGGGCHVKVYHFGACHFLTQRSVACYVAAVVNLMSIIGYNGIIEINLERLGLSLLCICCFVVVLFGFIVTKDKCWTMGCFSLLILSVALTGAVMPFGLVQSN